MAKGSFIRFGVLGVSVLAALLQPGLLQVQAGEVTPEAAPLNQGKVTPPEDDLLRHLCRYLKLTRTQILRLVPFARHTSRGRELLERECNERRRVFEPLAASQPEAAERLRLAMEQRRTQVNADLTAVGARALIRNLTREQIALVWRLGQGNPPKYAQADPALLDPAAGFSQQTAQQYRALELLRLDSRQVDPLVPEQCVPLTIIEDLGAEVEVQRSRRALLRPNAPDLLDVKDQRPFPQLVAETNNPDDLLPALQPLSERLFFSDRWLPVLEEILRMGENPAGSARTATPGVLRLVRDYRMERGFRDLSGKGEELEPLGGIMDHGRYVFDPGQGLRVPDPGVTDQYAIQLNLLYRGGDGYQKILDFKNRSSDGGLYFYQGRLTFYTLATGGVPQPEVEHRLRVERDRSIRTVRVYLDLRPVFAFIDLDDDAVFEKGSTALFVDDKTTSNEQGAGALRSLSVWGPAATR